VRTGDQINQRKLPQYYTAINPGVDVFNFFVWHILIVIIRHRVTAKPAAIFRMFCCPANRDLAKASKEGTS
jgi:hypothetical protein